jgi:hypothetical protein
VLWVEEVDGILVGVAAVDGVGVEEMDQGGHQQRQQSEQDQRQRLVWNSPQEELVVHEHLVFEMLDWELAVEGEHHCIHTSPESPARKMNPPCHREYSEDVELRRQHVAVWEEPWREEQQQQQLDDDVEALHRWPPSLPDHWDQSYVSWVGWDVM